MKQSNSQRLNRALFRVTLTSDIDIETALTETQCITYAVWKTYQKNLEQRVLGFVEFSERTSLSKLQKKLVIRNRVYFRFKKVYELSTLLDKIHKDTHQEFGTLREGKFSKEYKDILEDLKIKIKN